MRKLQSWFTGLNRSRPPEGPVDLLSDDFITDPGPTYARLRRHAPLAPVAQGGYLLTRHADIVAALTNPALGNAPSRFSVLAERNRARETAAAVAAHIPPFQDRPAHVAARQSLSRAFHGAFAGAATWIGALAQDHVAARRGQTCELIAELAQPFACAVMARFVGLPEDPARIKSITDGFFRLFAPISSRDDLAAVNAALDGARNWIFSVPTPAEGSLLARLRATDLSPEAVADNAILVLADGIENIEAGIAICLDTAHRNAAAIPPETGLSRVIDEALRLSTPAQIIARVAREPLSLHDTRIGTGVPVFLALGSANLDPEAHAAATEFRPDREGDAVLTFGRGRHGCIGAPLGRLMIDSFVTALWQAGAQPADAGPLEYHRRFGHRWPVRMQIRL